MARDVMTNAEMQAEINAGHPVLYKGKILRTIPELPNDAQILLDYPLYGYTRFEGNAKAILGYEIFGSLAEGVVPQFNNTTKRWELNTITGSGSSVGGSDKEVQFNNNGSLDGIPSFEYDPTDNWSLNFSPSSGKTGLLIKEPGSTPVTNIQGFPVLTQLHTVNSSTYWGVGFSSDATPATWATCLQPDGVLNLSYDDTTDTGSYYLYRNGLALFGSVSSTHSGTFYELSDNVYGLGLSDDVIDSGNTNRIKWGLDGVTHYVPPTAILDANLPANHLHFSIDETNDLLRVKWKESGGTVLSSIVLTSALGTTGTGSLVFSISPTITTPTIAKLANLTTNGFVKTSGSDGTLSVDTNTYLTSSGAVTSLAGTTNQITASASTGSVTLSLPSSVHIAGTMFVGSTSGIQFGDGGGVSGTTTGFLAPVSDGVFRFGDSAGGGSPHIILGSNSSSFVRFKRNGTALAVRLGDDSADGDITARLVTHTLNSVGTGTSSVDALVIQNTTLAAAGSQQYTPLLVLDSQGWKTTATAGSQSVKFAFQGRPVQGTTTPFGTFSILRNINSAGYVPILQMETGAADTDASGILYIGRNAGGSTYCNIACDSGGMNFRFHGTNVAGLAQGTRFDVKKPLCFNVGSEDSVSLRNTTAGSNTLWLTTLSSSTVGGNFVIGPLTQSVGTSGTATLVVTNGTAPTSRPADEYQNYSEDWAAGDARMNILTESGALSTVIGNNAIGTHDAVAGTDVAGTGFTIFGGRGRGTGVGGSIIFQVAPAGSTGSGVNSLSTRLTIPTTGGIVIAPVTSAAPTASGTIAYDSTTDVVKAGVNGATVDITTFPVAAYSMAAPGASQTLLRLVFDRAVNIAGFADGTNANVKSGVAATAQTDFTVKKNGSTFATIRFAAAGTQATWQSSTSTDFAAGDILTIVAPVTPDATLADIGFTITAKMK